MATLVELEVMCLLLCHSVGVCWHPRIVVEEYVEYGVEALACAHILVLEAELLSHLE